MFGNGHRLRHRSSENALKTQPPLDIRPQSNQSEFSQRTTNSALASSPLLHEEFDVQSMGGPLPTEGANPSWDALDDGSVISESVSPLVEAERESYMMSENGGLDGYKFSDRFRKAIVEEEDESYSHAAMSVRAEEILANAKRRLTVSFLRSLSDAEADGSVGNGEQPQSCTAYSQPAVIVNVFIQYQWL